MSEDAPCGLPSPKVQKTLDNRNFPLTENRSSCAIRRTENAVSYNQLCEGRRGAACSAVPPVPRYGNVDLFLVFPENSDMTSFSDLIIPRLQTLCCHNFVLVKIVVTYASLFFGALQKISGMPLVLRMENASDEPRCRCFLRCPQKTATFGPDVIRHPCTDGL